MNKIWKMGTNIMSYIKEIEEYRSKYGDTFEIKENEDNIKIIFLDFGNGNIIEKNSSTLAQVLRVLLTLGFVQGNYNSYQMDKYILRNDTLKIINKNENETMGNFISKTILKKIEKIYVNNISEKLYPSENKLIFSIMAVFFFLVDNKKVHIINDKIQGNSVEDIVLYYYDVAVEMINSSFKDELIKKTIEFIIKMDLDVMSILSSANNKSSIISTHLYTEINLDGQLLPKSFTFGSFLKNHFNSNNKIKIPVYQRKYIWKKQNVETLLNDIKKIKDFNTHYVGNIIIKDESNGFETINRIIDGQQRITTFMLIIKGILDFGKFNKWEVDNSINEKITGLKENIIAKTFLRIEGNDDFDSFINVITSNRSKKRLSSQINNIYTIILNWLSINIISNDNFKKFQQNLLNKITMVIINAKSSNEYILFEKLNTGSVPLTTLELFKNYIINIFASDNMPDEKSQKLFQKYIEEPFKNSKNKDADVKKFIITYLRIENSKINKDTIFYQFKNIIEQKYINNNFIASFEEMLKDIGEEIKIYKEISTYKKYNNKSSWAYGIADFLYMFDNRTVYYPLIIRLIRYCYKNITNPNNEEINKLREYLRILEIYEVRLQVAIYRGQSLSKKIESILIKLNEKTTFKEFWNLVSGYGSNSIASIDQLVDALKNKGIQSKPAKLIMTRIENFYYLNRGWKVDKGSFTFRAMYEKPSQREHLLPVKWQKHWLNDLKKWKFKDMADIEIEMEVSKYIDYVGNAFPIPDWSNIEITNQSLSKKMSKIKEKQYDKDLILLKGIENKLSPIKKSFTTDDILKRSKEISEIAREIWADWT